MNKYGKLLSLLVIGFFLITACAPASTPTPAPVPTATVTPAPTEKPFGCYEDPYYWVDEEKYPDAPKVEIPWGQTIEYKYESVGLTWVATLGCNDFRSHTISDMPIYLEGPTTTLSCPSYPATFTVIGIEVVEYKCDYSLLFGDEDQNPPQISIRFNKDGREMIYDLEFRVESMTRQDQTTVEYLDYLVWAGYTDTNDWADVRCYSKVAENDYGIMGFAGAFGLEDSTLTSYDAFCGGEGFVIEMTTTR